jgi:hypothetical protein
LGIRKEGCGGEMKKLELDLALPHERVRLVYVSEPRSWSFSLDSEKGSLRLKYDNSKLEECTLNNIDLQLDKYELPRLRNEVLTTVEARLNLMKLYSGGQNVKQIK